MKKVVFLTLAIAVTLGSCRPDVWEPEIGQIEGLKPVYAQAEGWDNVTSEEPRAIKKLGKIYHKDNFIYVVEQLQGIHVIDNSEPTSPVAVKFIQVPGCRDIAMKGDYLYTDNVTDLVVLDVADLEQINVVNRIPDLYDEVQQSYPEFAQTNTYFECVDASKGIVVDWEVATLTNPKCQK